VRSPPIPAPGALAIRFGATLLVLTLAGGCVRAGPRPASSSAYAPCPAAPEAWADPTAPQPADEWTAQTETYEPVTQAPPEHEGREPATPVEPAVVRRPGKGFRPMSPERVRTVELETKRIYGPDDRRDVAPGMEQDLATRAPDAPGRVGTPEQWAKRVLEASRAVALVVHVSELGPNEDGSATLATQTYSARAQAVTGKPLCAPPRARFQSQPTAGFCTAWLAGPSLVVTARHCVAGRNVSELAFVFGWQQRADGRAPAARLEAAQVFRGKRLVTLGSSAEDGDYAVIELDRSVEEHANIVPLSLRRTGRPRLGEPLYLLGFPRGLPLKFADGAAVRKVHASLPLLRADLDAFHGNSGSPVLSSLDHRVVGILVRGLSDFELVGDPPCTTEVRSNLAAGGETVLGSVAFQRFVPSTVPR